MTQRQRELDRERRWELYRRSVIERMPESDYKTAVLAGIAHKLMTLDRLEAGSQASSIAKAARTRNGSAHHPPAHQSSRSSVSGSGSPPKYLSKASLNT
jgi:hypothetical protein